MNRSVWMLLPLALGAGAMPMAGCGGSSTVPPGAPANARSVALSLFDIDCVACVDKVVAELRKEGAVYQATFDKKRVVLHVVVDPAITDERMLAAVRRAGFRAQIGDAGGSYEPEAKAPAGADVSEPVADGSDVPDLAKLVVPRKVTIVDFLADWCGPCRDVDRHVKELLEKRTDVAYRRLDVVDWDTPLAAHYLRGVPSLPYVIVYAADGRRIDAIAGLDLPRLDAALARGPR